MEKQKKDFFIGFIILFIVIYMAAPYYFYIAGVKFIYIWSIIGCLMLIVLNGKIVLYKKKSTALTIGLSIIIFVDLLIYILNNEFFTGIAFLCEILLVPIILIPLINSKERFLRTINGIINFSICISILGIIEEIFKFNFFSIFNNIDISLNYNPLRFGILRILSFHSHAIIYCLWIMFMIGLLYYALSIPENKKYKNKYIIAYILLLINALCTLSRSALLVLVLLQILLLYKSGYKLFIKKIIQIACIAIVLIIISILFIPQLKDLIFNTIDMMIALFDDNYAQSISNSFGNDNLSGIGNRVDLYSWVLEKMNGKWLLGNGIFSDFVYKYKNSDGYWTQKTTIEVQYLNVLYHKGILGLGTEVLLYLLLIITTFEKKSNKKMDFESYITFGNVCNIIFLCYAMILFAVNTSTERNTFYVIVMLLLSYNNLNKENNVNDYKK